MSLETLAASSSNLSNRSRTQQSSFIRHCPSTLSHSTAGHLILHIQVAACRRGTHRSAAAATSTPSARACLLCGYSQPRHAHPHPRPHPTLSATSPAARILTTRNLTTHNLGSSYCGPRIKNSSGAHKLRWQRLRRKVHRKRNLWQRMCIGGVRGCLVGVGGAGRGSTGCGTSGGACKKVRWGGATSGAFEEGHRYQTHCRLGIQARLRRSHALLIELERLQ